MTTFLHGVETIEVKKGSASIKVVKSATIALFGIAPEGPAQALTLVSNPTDAAQFGANLPGFNIPQALDLIYQQGGATVVVVNVYNEDLHRALVTDEALTVASRKAKLDFAPIGFTAGSPANKIILSKAGSPGVIYVEGVDYTLDAFGNIQFISSAVLDGASLLATYYKLDLTQVSDAQLIGTIDGSNVKTGSKLFDNCFNSFGFRCKLYISPDFDERNAIATQLRVLSTKFKGYDFATAPAGTTKQDAITGRGPSGTINFNVSGKRSMLLYDHLIISDPDPGAASGSEKTVSYSAVFAGITCNTDNNEGYWTSPSNQIINGVLRPAIALSWAINDASGDVNGLNEVGITSIANGFGSGLRTWGNRNASYPTVNVGLESFMAVVRTADIVDESVELAMLPFIDKPINQAQIDSIVFSVQDFINTQIGRGALLQGSKCYYDPADNPSAELAQGHLVLRTNYCSGPPMERLTFNRTIDSSLLVFS
jgi:phage tail sheath protein FI